MRITIRLYHGLGKYLPHGGDDFEQKLEVPHYFTVESVLRKLGVPQPEERLIFVNGVKASTNKVLSDEDLLVVMKPAGGG